MQQAVDAAEIHEGAVIGKVLDHTLDDCAFLQVFHERAALGGELLLDDGAARDHDVVALLVKLDDLELKRLAFQVGRVAHRADIDQRTRQERADILELDGETALDATGDDTGDDLGVVERLLEARPGAGALGLLTRQSGLAIAVFHGIQGDLNLVTGHNFDFTAFIAELIDGDHGLGLQANVHDHHVVADTDDQARQDHPRAHPLVGKALFEQFAKRFGHTLTRCARLHPAALRFAS